MRVLLIKTSSMGDIIHTLPALTDAGRMIKGIQFDWVVESPFAEIPAWHPLVNEVIPIALRRWRKNLFAPETRLAWRNMRERLHEREYDIVIDAQGLAKSALITFFAKGVRTGLDWRSAREAIASLAYQRKYKVNFHQHAVVRMRQLLSQALQYPLSEREPDFGLSRDAFRSTSQTNTENYIVFLHGTTWTSKQWPETYWTQLAKMAAQQGYQVKIGGFSQDEVEKANRIASHCDAVEVVPGLSIPEMARLLANAKGAVAVDTGFGHLAAALSLPTVSIYGPTNPEFTGAFGRSAQLLAPQFACAPCLKRTCSYRLPAEVAPACYTTVGPNRVWTSLSEVMAASAGAK